MSTKHAIAAARFLENKENEAWHDHTLWMVRTKRDKMSHSLPEWERLRELASEIKLYSNSHLDTLLEEFEKNAIANGAIVHWAKDAEEHNEIVLRILRQHDARNLIKSKSMLTEECHMNEFLMSKGIDVVESDLGERILQLMHLAPSHIVGANFAVASTGEIVVCTNEGNADMGTSFPKVHIATMGMEKIVPNLEALGVFTRLLARSGTGQPITSYTSHYRRPSEGQEFHIIIVDNGRSDILAKPDHIRTLNCIRCGECMNTCPVYRRSGGYSYTYFIPGPIGINLGMLRNPEEYSDNVSACSLCLSCSNVCPVKIDLGEQIYRWRQDLDKIGKASKEKKVMSFGMKFLMERPGLFNTALKFAPVVNHLPRFMVYNGLNAWGKGRELPTFAKESFNDMWKNNKVR